MHGTVRDASGAAVPAAQVKATNTQTGVARSINSGADGGYIFTNLATGTYQVEVSKEGFSTAVQGGIVLQVNSDPLVDIALKIGAVTEQVNVEANAAQVETRNSTVGTVIENQRILELPLNGRDVTSLITLAGGAVSMGTARVGMGGSGINIPPLLQIAGGLGYATSYTLDGANHMNMNSGSAVVMPFPDALQEFKVDTSGASIDQGRSSGVAAVTKSGTNNYHGDLFEFMRNDGVNARQYFSPGKSTLKRHQFGGTLGGPIKKDKLFFFGAYQQTTLRQNPGDKETWVPTAKMLAGDFRDYASAACGQVRGVLRPPFVNGQLPASAISKTAVAFMNKFRAGIPADLSPDLDPNGCGHIRYGQPDSQTELQGVGRMDYQLSDRHTLFARYQDVVTYQPPAAELSPNNILDQQNAGRDDYTQSLALGSTYVFGPTMVNAFRISGTFSRVRAPGVETFSLCDAQAEAGLAVTWAGSCVFFPHGNTLLISNGPPFNAGTSNPFNMTLFSLNDDFNLIRGAHQMTFGFVGSISKNTANFYGITPGRITFDGSATGTGLSDFMSGKVAQLVQTAVNRMDVTSITPSLYFADSWKAKQRLTVAMSVRWDPYIPQPLKRGGVANFDMGRFLAGTKTSQYKYPPSGWYYPGDPGYPGDPNSSSGIDPRYKYFAPRLGLAWDVTGDGRTSLRSSFAYTYSPILNYWRQDGFDNSPWDMGLRRTGVNLNDPWSDYTWVDVDNGGVTRSGSPYPFLVYKGFVHDGDQISTDININAPRTSSWNLSLQRQLGTDWVVSAAYMGANTTHIWIQDYLNPAQVIGTPRATNCGSLPVSQCSGPDNVPERRLFNQLRPLAPVGAAGPGNEIIRMGTVSRQYSGATMSYEGLLLSAQKRFSRGTTLQANYTWSHCLGDAADIVSSGPDAGESHTKPGDRTFDRGNCNGDRRHIFNLTAVGRTPKFSGRALRLLASDWQLAGIYHIQSGQPLTIGAGSDRALNGQLGFFQGSAYQRADQILPNAQTTNPDGGGPLGYYLCGAPAVRNGACSAAAFDVPALGTVGGSRRNEITYVPLWNFDIALSRSFNITEAQRIELRGEAFNVLNSFIAGTPGFGFTTVSSGIFGQIRNAQDTRILQFALKYVF